MQKTRRRSREAEEVWTLAMAIRHRDVKMLVTPSLQASQLPGYANTAIGAQPRPFVSLLLSVLLSATRSRAVVLETMGPESLKYVLLGSARQFADPVFGGQPTIPQTRAPCLAGSCH